MHEKINDKAAVAEMYLLGDWKLRRSILRRLQHMSIKQRLAIILWACFVDVCKVMWGKDWVRGKLEGEP